MEDNFERNEEEQNDSFYSSFDEEKNIEVNDSNVGYDNGVIYASNNRFESSKLLNNSRLILIIFYLMALIVGIIVFVIIRSNKYAFYLKKSEVLIMNGSSYQVELTPKDINRFDYLNYKYQIDNPQVATVDNYGTVTAVGVGETNLKIKLKFGIGSKVMKIKTEDTKINSIELKVDSKGKLEQKEKISLYVNESISLHSFANKIDDFNINVKYSSSDSNIVVVNEFGTLTAKSVGVATISGTKDGITGSIIVEVKEKPSPSQITKVKVESIDIGITNTTEYVGNKLQLYAKVSPSNASNSNVQWTSNNSSVAEVNENGLVTMKSKGTVIIKAIVDGKEASGTILVKDKPTSPINSSIEVNNITLNQTNLNMNIGEKNTLVATINPDNATNKSIIWTSSNSNVVSVSGGVLNAIEEGIATITAKSNNGKTATCNVVVVKPVPAIIKETGITLNKTTISLDVGASETLVATVLPSDATDKSVTWTSSDNSIVTIGNGIITGKKEGTAIITAETKNGLKASCNVTIVKPAPPVIKETGVTLNKTSISLDVGTSETLVATVLPSNATDKSITWTSSDNSIVTVNKGVVKALKDGSATITVKTKNGLTAACSVIVNKENCDFNLKEGNTSDIANSNSESFNKTLQCARRNKITFLKVPKGNYYFEAVNNPILIDFSNISLDLNESIFNVYKNGSYYYNLIKIDNKDAGTVTVKNGTLKGDRYEHTCSDGSNMVCNYQGLQCPNDLLVTHEIGNGISIYSQGVTIDSISIYNMTGDGIYIQADDSKTGSINITNNVIDNVRRNGISVIYGKDIIIRKNTIRNTKGTWPQVGIDLERDLRIHFYENVLIEENSIYGNAGRRSVQIFPGIKGYIKIINNHLGDQIVGWNHPDGSILERDLIIASGNDTNIPSNDKICVEDANEAMNHINRECFDQIVLEDKCP